MRKSKKRTALILLTFLLVALVIWIAWGNTALELTSYTVTCDELPAAFDGLRIAQVSDLHNTELGVENETLLAMLRDAAPHVIVLTGDLIDSRRTDIDVALRFVKEAVKIAPCYYVAGNHEARVDAYDELREGLLSLGVTVLEDACVTLERSGESITLVGVNDPSFHAGALLDGDATVMESVLHALIDEDRGYTVLLSHRPELLDVYASFDIDLVLSGHAHGGQIRLPFVGGLFAPDQGFFPTYDAGLYTQGNTCMIVSRGIGNSIFPFRVNNRPEVVLIELTMGGQDAS